MIWAQMAPTIAASAALKKRQEAPPPRLAHEMAVPPAAAARLPLRNVRRGIFPFRSRIHPPTSYYPFRTQRSNFRITHMPSFSSWEFTHFRVKPASSFISLAKLARGTPETAGRAPARIVKREKRGRNFLTSQKCRDIKKKLTLSIIGCSVRTPLLRSEEHTSELQSLRH